MTEKSPVHAFVALDGLRGVAAILVALFHFRSAFIGYDHYPAGDGYLAVDLFFLLSGFVLAHAYTLRFQQGMSVIQFIKIRLIRLYPLYFLGLAIGTVILAAGLDRPNNLSAANIVSAFALETFMLPAQPTIEWQLFPINSSSWSLFFELIVNMLFVIFWRRLNLRMLLLVLVASGSVFAACTLYKHIASFGNLWHLAPVGVPRAVFSFSMGLLIHRLYAAGKLRMNVGLGIFLLGVTILAIYLLTPVNDAIRGLYDLVFIVVISPALVVIGVNSHLEGKWVGLFSFLGTTSYALYTIHGPPINVVKILANKVFILPPALLISMLSVASLLAISYVVDLVYDGPTRRALTARMRNTSKRKDP